MEKLCTQCKIVKAITEFSVSRQGVSGPVYRSNCKKCASAKAHEWYKDNLSRAQMNQRRFHLKKNYGVTLEQYQVRLDSQGGVCAICGDRPDQWLAVDHCHSTGAIRGLLCNNCNRAIGLLGDRVDRLKAAINYLERE